MLKLDKSSFVKTLHSENISLMFVTFDVSKEDTSKLASCASLLNIPAMLVTLEVLKYLLKLILVKLLKYLNK